MRHGKKTNSVYWGCECEIGFCLDGATIKTSTSNPVPPIAHIQHAHVTSLYKSIISKHFSEIVIIYLSHTVQKLSKINYFRAKK
jgi:hypothetical protein